LLCFTCGEPFESSEPLPDNFKANLLLQALGSSSALRVLLALRNLGEAHVRAIGRETHIGSRSAIERALHRLHDAGLVSRRPVPSGIQVGRVRHHWSLNRAHPLMMKILELLAEVTM
jgi:predicted transcriptional regulator